MRYGFSKMKKLRLKSQAGISPAGNRKAGKKQSTGNPINEERKGRKFCFPTKTISKDHNMINQVLKTNSTLNNVKTTLIHH